MQLDHRGLHRSNVAEFAQFSHVRLNHHNFHRADIANFARFYHVQTNFRDGRRSDLVYWTVLMQLSHCSRGNVEECSMQKEVSHF